MPELSMNQVIHAAVRRDLARFVEALNRFRDGDRARAEQLATAWDNFLRQLTRHHEGEHEIVWPVLERLGVDRSLLGEMDAEHDRLAGALREAGEQIARLKVTASGPSAGAAREAMVVLRTVTEEHFAHEESELEPVMAAKKGDPALKSMGRQLGKSSPADAGTFFAWVTDRASPAEQAAVAQHVPRPVVIILRALFGRRYRREIASIWRSA
jgi:hemerythrin-like domain-containing protein